MTAARDKYFEEAPLLARVWQEDGVWNISAFDLPIVAYGERIDDARANFTEAVHSHAEALVSLHRFESVAESLHNLSTERGFYEERVRPHWLVESFVLQMPLKQAA